MLLLEVLIGELLSVDGLATSALGRVLILKVARSDCIIASRNTHVVVGEVTTLEHEVGDDTVERRSSVAESLFTSAKGAEVLGCLGDYIVVKLELDTAIAELFLVYSSRQLAFSHHIKLQWSSCEREIYIEDQRRKLQSKPCSCLRISIS